MEYRMIVAIAVFALAGTLSAVQAQDVTVYLLGKDGKKTPYVKPESSKLSLSDKAAAEKARNRSAANRHAGDVCFKKGVISPAHRYITTGHIAIRFTEGTHVDPKAFAAENGLVYVDSIGQSGRNAVFINASDRDDISESNVLLQKGEVDSAEPDWVLPVKLY